MGIWFSVQSDNSDIYANSAKFGKVSRDKNHCFSRHSFLANEIPIHSRNREETIP